MKKVLLFSFFLPLFALAQKDSLLSGVYKWKNPVGNGEVLSSAILFEGKVQDMQWLQMSANALRSSKARHNLTVPDNQEQLLIIKSGSLLLDLDGSAHSLGAGSVAVLLPGKNFSLENNSGQPCDFYLMKYRSKNAVDAARGTSGGGSMVIDWGKTIFKAHDKGGRRDFFERPTAMCKRMEMHVSTLNQGLKSHDPHTHRAEEIVLVTEGQTTMQIGDKFYKGKGGSIYYLGSNVLHAVQNTGSGSCTYFAFQFE